MKPPPAQSAQKCSRQYLQNHIINFLFPQKLHAGVGMDFLLWISLS